MKLPIQTEHEIQSDIIQFLRIKGFYVQRLNSGRIPIGEGRSRRMIQLAEVGTPDLMAFKGYLRRLDDGFGGEILHSDAQVLFIEVKRPGNKPTIHQEHKMRELESFGARCLVAHSVEEVEKAL